MQSGQKFKELLPMRLCNILSKRVRKHLKMHNCINLSNVVKAFVTGWSALLEVVENTLKAYYWDRLAGMVMVVKSLRETGVFRRAP